MITAPYNPRHGRGTISGSRQIPVGTYPRTCASIFGVPKTPLPVLKAAKLDVHSAVPEGELSKSVCSDQKTETKKCNKNCKKRRSLLVIVQDLIDKNVSKSPLRMETVVSPRKRFLREMERDKSSHEDMNLKRSKNKITSNQVRFIHLYFEKISRVEKF